MPGPGSSEPILEWERQMKEAKMKRPLPTTTNLRGLEVQIEQARQRAASYARRAWENDGLSLYEELDRTADELEEAGWALEEAIKILERLEAIAGPP